MHCVNHPGTEVQFYCQHCGKPLCENCVRKTASGQVLCQECLVATGGDPGKAPWQGVRIPPGQVPPGQVPQGQAPFYPFPTRGPNPNAAAVLGLIPGVGAMYNGQLFKGLIHVVVFAVLVSITDRYTIFLIFVFAWCLYQSFEAFHTAKARRDGLPVPDPFGLNEVGSWLNFGSNSRPPGTVHGAPNPVPPQGYPTGAGTEPPPYNAPYTSSWTAGTAPGSGSSSGTAPGPMPGQPGGQPGAYSDPQPPYTEPYPGTYQGAYPGAYQAPYSKAPYTGVYPGNEPYADPYPPGFVAPGAPPGPSTRPPNWRRREPVFAFVLIGLGVLFLMQSMGIVGHVLHYVWPFMLIGMGIWLILRRMGDAQGGSK